MRLVYLPCNAAWVFLWHDQLIRLEGFVMFHPTKKSAIEAAKVRGLSVDKKGNVECTRNT